MKKILSLFLTAAILISAAGCSGYDNDKSSSSPSSSSTQPQSSGSMSSTVNDIKDDMKDTADSMNPMKKEYEDGTYRGAFVNPAEMDVTFVVKNGKFQKIEFNSKEAQNGAGNPMDSYKELADYLIGKDVTDLKPLYEPMKIIPDMKDDKIEGGKLISAINDGLNRGVYKPYQKENPSPDADKGSPSSSSKPENTPTGK